MGDLVLKTLGEEIHAFIKISVIAEGVENKKMVEALKKVGCTGLQGYYFAKPLREEEFIAYMKSGEYITDSAEG